MSLVREVLIWFLVLKGLLAAQWRTGGGDGLEGGAAMRWLWQGEG